MDYSQYYFRVKLIYFDITCVVRPMINLPEEKHCNCRYYNIIMQTIWYLKMSVNGDSDNDLESVKGWYLNANCLEIFSVQAKF